MKKVLFVSGSVGLGHVQRDVRIARELLVIHDDLQISWLVSSDQVTVLQRLWVLP